MVDPAGVQDPPPRQPWEEPPAAGWSSQLSGVGLETLSLLTAGAVTVGIVRLLSWAERLQAHPASMRGFGHALAIAAWVVPCIATAGVLVFLWKRLGGFALLAAMLTDYGRVYRLGGRPPVWLDDPPAGALRLLHLSDLHVAEGPRVRLVERAAPGGNAQLAALLDHPRVEEGDVLLFTGDITDRGTAVAWRCFLDALDERGLTDRAILVPGNHDLALVDPIDPRARKKVLRADRFGIVQLANLLKFAEAFAETGGGKTGFVIASGELVPFRDAWLKVERAVRPLVAQLPSEPVPPMRLKHWASDRLAVGRYGARIEEARRKLLQLFPVAVPIAGHDAVVFVLNSCVGVSHHPATNALGHVGRAQYKRLAELAQFFAQRVKLVALHHHVVRRAEERGRQLVERLLAKLTVLGDVRPLVRFCKRHGVRAVLNGHRHLSYQLRLPNGTVLLAAPSSTLGDELAQDPRPNFSYYEIGEPSGYGDPTVGMYRAVVRTTTTT